MLTCYTTFGVDRPLFNAGALATNMAAKLGEAVFSMVTSFWGSGSRSAAAAPKAAAPKKKADAEAMLAAPPALPVETSLTDPRRRILSLSLSPLQDLLATTDNFGRVMLLDTATSTVVRIWKGYRDASIGWILCEEPVPSVAQAPLITRRVLFMVLYAQRRGLLEIWSMRMGSRVAAFNVGADCVLLPQRPHSGHATRCFLFFLRRGEIKEVVVPFDSALTVELNSFAKDRQTISRIRGLLQSETSEPLSDPSLYLPLLEDLSSAASHLQVGGGG